MGRNVYVLALALCAFALPAASADPPKCSYGKLGEFKVTMQGTRGIVAAKINGVETNLIVDTGAFFSSLDNSARGRFALKRGVMPPNMRITGVGGVGSFEVGRADTFEVGTFKLSDIDFLIGGPTSGSSAAGFLGANILSAADVEYDFANGQIRMFKPDGPCDKTSLSYWAGDKPVGVLSLQEGDNGLKVMGTATVNGRNIKVIFDTGASYSVLKKSAAERVGFKSDAPGVVAGGLSSGVGRDVAESWIAPFASFEIGGEKITATRLRVATINLGDADMLLGADFFLSHRILVAKSQKRIYFTYNGGPVFRLERGDAATRPPREIAAAAPAAAEPKPGDPTDADALARRAAASAARRDYAAAVADLTKAIALKPDNPEYFFQRASAHQAARQPLMAIADYDETLKLKPDHVMALVNRGEMFLNNRNPARAKADFDAANKAADSADTVGVRIGSDYLRAGLVDEAIAEYTAWLTAHPKDERNPGILNGRCYARALGNKELDLALADCNAAIHYSANSAALDSRGLVYLRMGQYDKAIADYNDAIKRQPRAANPLYGRGLAKVKKGQADEGHADMQAALAMDPSLAVQVKRFNLTE